MSLIKNKIDTILSNIDFENIKDHPNILIAARFWEEDRYEAAKICYKFMRYIDDLIDDRKADGNAFSCLEKQLLTDKVNNWIDCLDGSNSEDPFIKVVSDTISRYKIPLVFFRNFARSMIYDINHDGFETFENFLDYAEGASNGPASVFVHLNCLRRTNGSYMPWPFDIGDIARPCAIFSYIVHIIRDFQKDQNNHLNYFALEPLKRNGLELQDLQNIAKGGDIPDGFRNVIAEYCEIAQEYRYATKKMLDMLDSQLEPRYLLSLHIIYNLYNMVFERIDSKKGGFTTSELNPTPEELKNRVLRVIQEKQHLF